MAKKTASKTEDKPIVAETPREDLNELEVKYNQLINEIKPKLLTKAQLKHGGHGIRSRYEREKGYEAVMAEINELGKKIGKPRIGLGHLRG